MTGSKRPLVVLPDPILRQVSRPVEQINDDVRKLADDMLATMYEAPGIGLAAIQIAEPIRLITIDLAKEDDEPDPHIFVNPRIVALGDEPGTYEEGCLSIPDYFAEVERPATVTVEYRDLEGEKQTIEADGLMATCLQHEIDHLDGVLFIDHISRLKRDMVIKKFKKLAKERGGTRLL
ncbi:peptide deformylase [Notoacmeibacter marinus]|uniref:Peptide deformylase n=1 Tax=Notoacmeibacter marinus TaxID=1876515 RepID=A0A231V0P6_9HYPH|nr:peptide deformylase [Notoacmeibacter marinus]OXT01785.1 peptide deformylase [Notoacmeibacter marinus]